MLRALPASQHVLSSQMRTLPTRFLMALLLSPAAITALPRGADTQPATAASGVVQSVIAPTNALLNTLKVANFPGGVVRRGVNALGDAPDLTFLPSSAPCPQNGGAGDAGSCVHQSQRFEMSS